MTSQTEPRFTDCVIDLETMGKGSFAPALEIGAVLLDRRTGEIGPKFSVSVSLDELMRFGAQPDASTIIWWMKQSEAARRAIWEGQDKAVSVHSALVRFSDFLAGDLDALPNPKVKVWGNGATFDCTILRNTYERHGLIAPWAFWNDRDLRTVIDVAELDKNAVPKPEGFIAHNALWDATYQAQLLVAALRRLHSGPENPTGAVEAGRQLDHRAAASRIAEQASARVTSGSTSTPARAIDDGLVASITPRNEFGACGSDSSSSCSDSSSGSDSSSSCSDSSSGGW